MFVSCLQQVYRLGVVGKLKVHLRVDGLDFSRKLVALCVQALKLLLNPSDLSPVVGNRVLSLLQLLADLLGPLCSLWGYDS